MSTSARDQSGDASLHSESAGGTVASQTTWRRAAAVALAVIAAASAAGVLANGYTSDDHWIIELNPRVHDALHAWRLVAQPYWPPENGVGDYRPLTMLGFAIEWALGRGAPWGVHVGGLLLYVGCVLAFWRLATRLLPQPIAWAIAGLFAAHPVHADVTATGVGQAEIWSALWVIIGVTCYLDWRGVSRTDARAGPPLHDRNIRRPEDTGPSLWPARRVVALGAVYALACASKEHGFMLPLVLAAAELTLVVDHRRWRIRLLDLARPAAALALTGITYIAARWTVTGSLRGDYPTFALAHASFVTRLLTALGAVPTVLALLLWPAHQAAEYMPQAISIYHTFSRALLSPAALVAMVVAVAMLARRAAPIVTFAILWTVLTRLPASNIVVPTGILLAPRVLFLPSVGVVLAVGGGVAWCGNRLAAGAPQFARDGRVAATVALAVLLVLGAWASESRARVWRDDVTLVSQTAMDAPRSYLAQYQWGNALFQLGRPREGEREMRLAMALFPGDPRPYIDLASQYARAGMCPPAIALYRQALIVLPTRPDAHAGLAECLARTGDYAAARSEARMGLGYHYDRGTMRAILARADSAEHVASVAPRRGHASGQR